jgi:serine phosphatase RsbU (regulator of sigma subunit)
MVAQTQMSFLPRACDRPEARYRGVFRPRQRSGDYYDVIPLDEHRTCFLLGDVSGKGLAAAWSWASSSTPLRSSRTRKTCPG